MIEAVDSGRRTVIERCDTEAHAAVRHATLTDSAWRIQGRLDAAADAPPPVHRARPPRRQRDHAHYPRVSFALPPELIVALLEEARRRQLGLSSLAMRLLATGLQRRRGKL